MSLHTRNRKEPTQAYSLLRLKPAFLHAPPLYPILRKHSQNTPTNNHDIQMPQISGGGGTKPLHRDRVIVSVPEISIQNYIDPRLEKGLYCCSRHQGLLYRGGRVRQVLVPGLSRLVVVAAVVRLPAKVAVIVDAVLNVFNTAITSNLLLPLLLLLSMVVFLERDAPTAVTAASRAVGRVDAHCGGLSVAPLRRNPTTDIRLIARVMDIIAGTAVASTAAVGTAVAGTDVAGRSVVR